MPLRFALGLSTLLVDPSAPKPGGYCRDELLFLPFDVGAAGDRGFEVREVLNADLPIASGSESDGGDLVVCASAGAGGPLPPAAAAHLLAQWRSASSTATIDTTFEAVGLPGRALLLGWPCRSVRVDLANHPLHGVQLVEVDCIKNRILSLKPAGEYEAVLAMLRLCAVHQFAVAVTEGSI